MKIRDIVEAWKKAKNENAERFFYNIEEIANYWIKEINPDDLACLMQDLEFLGEKLKKIEKEEEIFPIIMVVIAFLQQHEETILKLMKAPELDIKFS